MHPFLFIYCCLNLTKMTRSTLMNHDQNVNVDVFYPTGSRNNQNTERFLMCLLSSFWAFTATLIKKVFQFVINSILTLCRAAAEAHSLQNSESEQHNMKAQNVRFLFFLRERNALHFQSHLKSTICVNQQSFVHIKTDTSNKIMISAFPVWGQRSIPV